MDMPKHSQSLLHENTQESHKEFEARTGSALRGLRNGLQVSRRLVLGKLPDELRGVENRRGRFRKTLEAAVVEAHGDISLVRAAMVAEATYWAGSIAIIDWLYRQRLKDLKATEIAQMSRQQAFAMGKARSIMTELLASETKANGLLEQLQQQYEAKQTEATNEA